MWKNKQKKKLKIMSILFYNGINDKWLKKYNLYQVIGTKLCMNMNT